MNNALWDNRTDAMTDKYVILFVLLVLVSLGSFVSFSRSSDVQERFEKQQKETANLLFALQDLVDST